MNSVVLEPTQLLCAEYDRHRVGDFIQVGRPAWMRSNVDLISAQQSMKAGLVDLLRLSNGVSRQFDRDSVHWRRLKPSCGE
jgi:hypothetical protein